MAENTIGRFHIIADIPYRTRVVPCYETGRFHRHKKHKEEFCNAVCGREVVRERDRFCSIIIANPRDWKYDWCRDCVATVRWKPEYAEELKARGILA